MPRSWWVRCWLLLWFSFSSGEALCRDAVDIAAEQVDANPKNKYVRSKNEPLEFDCSGLTWYAFGALGVELPLQAHSQANSNMGVLLANPRISELQRGDLVFFETDPAMPGVISHVGIYEGSGKMLNAVSEAFGLERTDFTTPWWSSRLRSARRLPTIVGTPSAKFSIGNSVRVTENDVNVRELRQQVPLGARNAGDTGIVKFGPVLQTVGGTSYWWWRIDFATDMDGWVAENFLQLSGQPVAPVTYSFTGRVTSIPLPGWQSVGLPITVGSTLRGSFTYAPPTPVSRTFVMCGELGYDFANALTNLEVTVDGTGRTFRLFVQSAPSVFQQMVQQYVDCFPRTEYFAVRTRTLLDGNPAVFSVQFDLGTSGRLPVTTQLPQQLPPLAFFDIEGGGAVAGNVAGTQLSLMWIMDSLTRQ